MLEDIIRKVLRMSPGNKKINRDLSTMRQLLRSVQPQLIPFQEEKELELMSLKVEIKPQKKGFDKIQTGLVHSIYHEPMVAFAYKDYGKNSRDAMLCCRTSRIELIYRIKKLQVDVYQNGSQVALIDSNHIMYGLKSRRALARVKPYSNDFLSIIIHDKEAGQLFNPAREYSHQQRAFSIVTNMNEEEEAIFMAIGLFEFVTRLLENKRKN
jgi:hypothetical protein